MIFAPTSVQSMDRLGDSVAAIDAEVGASDIASCITAKESNGTHKVFGAAHLALWDERDPLLCKLRVVVEDLLGAVQ